MRVSSQEVVYSLITLEKERIKALEEFSYVTADEIEGYMTELEEVTRANPIEKFTVYIQCIEQGITMITEDNQPFCENPECKRCNDFKYALTSLRLKK